MGDRTLASDPCAGAQEAYSGCRPLSSWPELNKSDVEYELLRIHLSRTWVNRGKERARLGFVRAWLTRFLELSSVVLYRLGRLDPIANPQQLVGGTQMLLDRGLGQVQAPGYLCVAQALGNHFQDLSLTG